EEGAGPFGMVDVDAVEHTNYPLVLTGAPGTRMAVRFQYDAALFEAETVRRLLRQLRVLLGEMAAAPQAPVWALPAMTAGERRTVLEAWNDTAVPYPRERCVHEVFAEQAARRPDA